jgi:hypothetical protein
VFSLGSVEYAKAILEKPRATMFIENVPLIIRHVPFETDPFADTESFG